MTLIDFPCCKPDIRSQLGRIQMHCTAQSTKPAEHKGNIQPGINCILFICLFKQITTIKCNISKDKLVKDNAALKEPFIF